MAHVRTQILAGMVSAVTGLTTTTTSVRTVRAYPADPSALPELMVYADSETIERDDYGTLDLARQVRRLEMVVEGRARAATGVDLILDQIALEVEAALAADPTLGGLMVETRLDRTQFEYDDEAEQPTAVVQLVYVVDYRLAATNPEVLIN